MYGNERVGDEYAKMVTLPKEHEEEVLSQTGRRMKDRRIGGGNTSSTCHTINQDIPLGS